MCLQYSPTATRNFKKQNKGKETITVYKMYDITWDNGNKKCLGEFYRYGKILRHGEIISSRIAKPLNDRETHKKEVHQGIHVYLDRKSAQIIKLSVYNNSVVVAVKANLDDLVAVGSFHTKVNNSAVFMKITIPESSWNKALGIKPRKRKKAFSRVKRVLKNALKQ